MNPLSTFGWAMLATIMLFLILALWASGGIRIKKISSSVMTKTGVVKFTTSFAIISVCFIAILFPGKLSELARETFGNIGLSVSMLKLALMGVVLALVAIFAINKDNWFSRCLFATGILFLLVSIDGGINWASQKKATAARHVQEQQCQGVYARYRGCVQVTLKQGQYYNYKKSIPRGECLVRTRSSNVRMEDVGFRSYRFTTDLSSVTTQIFLLNEGESHETFTCGQTASTTSPVILTGRLID